MAKRHFIAIALSGATGIDQLPQTRNDWYSPKGHRLSRQGAMSEFEPKHDFLGFCFKFSPAARATRRIVKSSPPEGVAIRCERLETVVWPAESAGRDPPGRAAGSGPITPVSP
jgi:hypothetical protein